MTVSMGINYRGRNERVLGAFRARARMKRWHEQQRQEAEEEDTTDDRHEDES